MTPSLAGRYPQAIHPLHALLLAGSLPLFLGAVLCDLAYSRTFEVQWANFASWLIAGGLLLSGLALLFALGDLLRPRRRVAGLGRYAAVLLATFVLAFINALVHARDAWASMPTGGVLSALVLLLALVATWLGFPTRDTGGAR